MAKKKNQKQPKSFSEAIGLNHIINDRSNFVTGIILICLAVFIVIAFISYFSTGQADQSLVLDLRPGEVENTERVFQNYCGSIGAIVSYYLISRCFGISAFLIPAFIILCGLRLMQAYKVNLLKWFFGMALVMIWSSVTLAKFLTPIMGDQVYNPGGDHGAFICQWLENVIGPPGLLAVLIIVAFAFLTYLTSETITFVRKIMNPIGYITNRVKFNIEDTSVDERRDISAPLTEPDPTVFDDPAPQTLSLIHI